MRTGDSFWDKADFTDHALFRDELPDDPESDPTLSALMAITGDKLHPPKETMLHWKSVGNDLYAEGGRKIYEAIEAYTSGLKVSDEDEFSTIRAQLLNNRANCYHRIQKFVECVDDGRRSIKLDKRNSKGYFHCARGSMRLELYQQALSFCEQGLAAVGDDHQARKCLSEIKDQAIALLGHMRSKTEAEEHKNQIRKLMKERGIEYTFSSEFSAPGCDIPRIEADGQTLVWSLLLLIDTYGVAEAAASVNENSSLNDVIVSMFPDDGTFAPWDTRHLFIHPNICAFIETPEGAHQPVDMDERLVSVIKKIKVIQKFPVFILKLRQESECSSS